MKDSRHFSRPKRWQVVREAWSVVRWTWRPLLVVTAITFVFGLLTDGAGAGIRRLVRQSSDLSSAGHVLDLAMILMAIWIVVISWLNGLGWMAIAALVSQTLTTGTATIGDAIKRVRPCVGRSMAVMLLLFALEAVAYVLSQLLAVAVLPEPRPIQGFYARLVGTNPITAAGSVFSNSLQGALAYIAFAPLALVFENASVRSAFVTSWNRVRGSWVWVCSTATMLWVPHGIWAFASRFLPTETVWSIGASAIADLTWTFLLVGVSCLYLHLMAIPAPAPAPKPALEPIDPGPEPPDHWPRWLSPPP
jgi:hypothetical protein